MNWASKAVNRLNHLYRGVLLDVRTREWEIQHGRRSAKRPPASTGLAVLEAFEPRLLMSGDLTATGNNITAASYEDTGIVTVATFTDADPNAQVGDYTAMIDYGDGNGSYPGDVVANSDGTFGVQGDWEFCGKGTYTISVTITDAAGIFDTSSNAYVSDAPISAGVMNVTAVEGTSFTGQVALFHDDDPTISRTHFTATINWGDGTAASTGTIANTGNSYALWVNGTHTYADAGDYTVTVDIAHNVEGGSTAEATGTATVVPVLAAVGTSITSTEGSSTGTVTVATFTDSDANVTGSDLIATIDWGDGSDQASGAVVANNDGGFSVQGDHAYAGAGYYILTVTVSDQASDVAAANSAAMVSVVPPTLTISGSQSVDEGSTYVLTLASSDAGNETITSWTVQWGDGSTDIIHGDPESASHVYASAADDLVISATATDPLGTYAAASGQDVNVNKVDPTLTISGDSSVDEGTTYTLNLSGAEPGNETIDHWTINWGDGSDPQTVTGDPDSVTHTYVESATDRTISATATDEYGTYAAGNTLAFTVNHVAPTLSISGDPIVESGTAYTLNLNSSEAGDDTIGHWTINWGDGSDPETVTGNPSSITHEYTESGTVTIVATATDQEGTYDAGNTINADVQSIDVYSGDGLVSGPHFQPCSWYYEIPAFANGQTSYINADGELQVYIHVNGTASALVGDAEALGTSVDGSNDSMALIQGWISGNTFDALEQESWVASVGLPDYGICDSVTSQGDSILKANPVRSNFGLDGTGVKVGVISDGVTYMSESQAAGELPNVVTVGLPGIPTTSDPHPNEGTAMLEIVHDLAPGAQLYFSSAGKTTLDMVNSINYLVDQGCSVIVDDVTFFSEPYFVDGFVATAVEGAISNGVTYVTSAGNSGSGNSFFERFHYQDKYYQGAATADGLGNWDTFGISNNAGLTVHIPPGGTMSVYLQWSDPWGSSGNDYDLYLFQDGVITSVKSSTNRQDGTVWDYPYETITFKNTSTVEFHGSIAIEKKNGAQTRELEMLTTGDDYQELPVGTTGDAIVEHAAATGVIAVGAIDATPAGNNTVEPYSSNGPSTIYSNLTNSQLYNAQTFTTRNTLLGCGIDGVDTWTGENGHFPNPFFGTSAAAPGVAALAALMQQEAGGALSLSPDEITYALRVTASGYGSYSEVSGYGMFDGLDAVYSIYQPNPPVLDTPNSDDTVYTPTPVFIGTAPAGAYVELFDEPANTHIFTLVGYEQLAANATTYSITSTALSLGSHHMMVQMAPSSKALQQNPSDVSQGSNSLIVTVAAAPATAITGITPTSGTFSSDGYAYTNASGNIVFTGRAVASSTVKLYYEGAGGNVQVGPSTTTNSTGVWSITCPKLSEGDYGFTAQATAPNLSVTWSPIYPVDVDRTAPTVTNVAATSANGTYSINSVIWITVIFNSNVWVKTAGGVPSLTLDSGGKALYVSGSDTNVLTFKYTVGSSQYARPLDYSSQTSLVLNGGTIVDQAGNAASLQLPMPWFIGSMGYNNDIAVRSLWGDVSGDGKLSAVDIDTIYATITANYHGYYWIAADVNGDGVVDQLDVTYELTNVFHTTYGDANLDGVVDFRDFQALLDNFQGGGEWAKADFNGDRVTDFLDFQILLDYWNPSGQT